MLFHRSPLAFSTSRNALYLVPTRRPLFDQLILQISYLRFFLKMSEHAELIDYFVDLTTEKERQPIKGPLFDIPLPKPMNPADILASLESDLENMLVISEVTNSVKAKPKNTNFRKSSGHKRPREDDDSDDFLLLKRPKTSSTVMESQDKKFNVRKSSGHKRPREDDDSDDFILLKRPKTSSTVMESQDYLF